VGIVGRPCHDDGAINIHAGSRASGLSAASGSACGARRSPGLGRLYYGYRTDRPLAADRLVGAVMLLRRQVLATVGGFDARYWLYAEEMDLCRRARQAGWELRYVPHARARHTGGQAAAVAPRPMLVEWFHSRLQYHAKFGPGWKAALIRLTYLSAWPCGWGSPSGPGSMPDAEAPGP
jgi:hypothetical protein